MWNKTMADIAGLNVPTYLDVDLSMDFDQYLYSTVGVNPRQMQSMQDATTSTAMDIMDFYYSITFG